MIIYYTRKGELRGNKEIKREKVRKKEGKEGTLSEDNAYFTNNIHQAALGYVYQ